MDSINHARIDKQNKKVYNKSVMISNFEILEGERGMDKKYFQKAFLWRLCHKYMDTNH